MSKALFVRVIAVDSIALSHVRWTCETLGFPSAYPPGSPVPMKSAITLAQVPEAANGPFVFHGPLAESFATAAACGFDAVELFLPGPDFISSDEVLALAEKHKLEIAAVGTGAGALCYGLTLMDPDPDRRAEAMDFLLDMIDFGGRTGAPAILGSMQGRHAPDMERDQALDQLAAALRQCAEVASSWGLPFIYESLNRYETNLFNRLEDAAAFLENYNLTGITLLADLFHMNIEEADIPATIRKVGPHIGHVHFADSNRRAVGFGHTDPAPVIAALRETGYQGYLSAEILPLPDPLAAARQTITSFRRATGNT